MVVGEELEGRGRCCMGEDCVDAVSLVVIEGPEVEGKGRGDEGLAQVARAVTQNWVARDDLQLVDIRQGTFAGRVLATVQNMQGDSLSNALLTEKLAKPYRGRRATWCDND